MLLGDLPYLAGVRDVAPPSGSRAREDLVQRMARGAARLGTPPYVGLTWRAGTDTPHRARVRRCRAPASFKEIDVDLLARAVAGVRGTLVSVQRVPAEGETGRLAAIAGRPVHDLSRQTGTWGA